MNLFKFAVWGFGSRGKDVVSWLNDKIVCIVEQNRDYQHTDYKDIPIISPEDYVSSYSEYPIIVTPKGYEQEIKQGLIEQGIKSIICYYEYILLKDIFYLPIENFLKKYDKRKAIIVYGGGFLGFLLYDYLVENGYKCGMALQHDYKDGQMLKDGLIEWTEENVQTAQIILAVPLAAEDESVIRNLSVTYEKYYDLILSRDFYYNPEVECFKNIYCGKRCFIVATGPSLTTEDLNTLHKNKEICFSVNGVFGAFDKTEWRPDYYVVGDPDAALKWKERIIEEDIKEKFIADKAWIFNDNEMRSNMHRWHIFRVLSEGKMPKFSDDFARGTYAGWTIVYDGALQLAAYMGFSEIYLIGVDCNYQQGGQNNYFYKENKKDNIDHRENEMILAYRAAEQYAKAHGIKIYNATRGGMLEEFERVDFDDLFH